MNNFQISTYGAPRWGAKFTGNAVLHKDNQARYYVNNVCVADMQVVDLFTAMTCVDGTTHYVLTAFFRLLDRGAKAEQAPAASDGQPTP